MRAVKRNPSVVDVSTRTSTHIHSFGNRTTSSVRPSPPAELCEAATRYAAYIPQEKFRINAKRDLDALLANEKMLDFWKECSDKLLNHSKKRWPLVADDARRVVLVFFFTKLLGILREKDFPNETPAAIRKRRIGISKKLRASLRTMQDETVAGFDVMKLSGLPANDRLQLPTLRFDDLLLRIIVTLEDGKPLSITDPLLLNRKMPQVARGKQRRQIFVRQELAALFKEHLGTFQDALVATALNGVLDMDVSKEWVSNYRKGMKKRG